MSCESQALLKRRYRQIPGHGAQALELARQACHVTCWHLPHLAWAQCRQSHWWYWLHLRVSHLNPRCLRRHLLPKRRQPQRIPFIRVSVHFEHPQQHWQPPLSDHFPVLSRSISSEIALDWPIDAARGHFWKTEVFQLWAALPPLTTESHPRQSRSPKNSFNLYL